MIGGTFVEFTHVKEWDLRHEDQIAECMKHSDIVYNLVGRDYETKYARLLYLRICTYAIPVEILIITPSMSRAQKR